MAVRLHLAALLACSVLSACVAEVDDGALDGAGQGLASGTLELADVYRVSASPGADGANMYSTWMGPFVVRRLAPAAAVKVLAGERRNGRYRVEHAGLRGWVAAADLTLVHEASQAALGCKRLRALERGRAALGFSYWWSNARWPASGGATTWPTRNIGLCNGSCGGTPGCTHAADRVLVVGDGAEAASPTRAI